MAAQTPSCQPVQVDLKPSHAQAESCIQMNLNTLEADGSKEHPERNTALLTPLIVTPVHQAKDPAAPHIPDLQNCVIITLGNPICSTV